MMKTRRKIMASGVGSGDVLARGGVRANFSQGTNVSQEKWDKIFKDYMPESEKPKDVEKDSG
jgi:hypothetical protein